MKLQEFSKQAVSAEKFSFNMLENKTEHMLNIANFLSQILPQQQQQQMDGYKSAFTQMDIVWKINFSSRECLGEKIYRFARTFRLVENRLKARRKTRYFIVTFFRSSRHVNSIKE